MLRFCGRATTTGWLLPLGFVSRQAAMCPKPKLRIHGDGQHRSGCRPLGLCVLSKASYSNLLRCVLSDALNVDGHLLDRKPQGARHCIDHIGLWPRNATAQKRGTQLSRPYALAHCAASARLHAARTRRS